MCKSRFSEEQIIAVVAEQERGLSTAEVRRRPGISQFTVDSALFALFARPTPRPGQA